jgi:hypothetical protein
MYFMKTLETTTTTPTPTHHAQRIQYSTDKERRNSLE